jgi:glycosyltransferase involved in cell wall biosynthesis
LSITSNQNKTCAVIPFYNEERTIAEVINRALNFVNAVIAVNDGSTDNSKKNVPKNERIICLENIVNEGKGVALNKGFAESTKRGFEFTITLDSDLQHIPDKIPDFILALNNYDIVIGNRLNDLSDMPLHRILSNKISSGLLSLKTGQKILDSQSGFRGFRTKILNDILPSFSGYEAESEILINAARKNYKIGFVPIPTIYADEKSKIKPVQIIFSFFKTLFI